MSPDSGSQEKRFIAFILLSFVIMVAYTRWIFPRFSRQKTVDNIEVTSKGAESIKKEETQEKLTQPETRTSKSFGSHEAEKAEAALLQNDDSRILLSNVAPFISGIEMKKYLDSSGKPVKLISLTEEGREYFPRLSGGFGNDLDIKYLYSYEASKATFRASKGGWDLEKVISLTDSPYLVDFSWNLRRQNAGDPGDLYLEWPLNMGSETVSIQRTRSGAGLAALYFQIGKNHPDHHTLSGRKNLVTLIPESKWLGLRSHYFLVSFIPEQPFLGAEIDEKLLTADLLTRTDVSRGFLRMKLPSNKGRMKIYAGPMEYSLLSSKGMQKFSLAEAVPLGYDIFRPFALGMLKVLKFFYGLTRSYGLSIVLLTLCVKLILWYPTQRSMVNMRQVQMKTKAIQPQIEAIKRRYKGDSSKIGEETMALYRQNGINPVAGCLPMLLQIPIMLSLYATLAGAIELRGAPMLWIRDLSMQDPFHILPIIMGIGMLFQTVLSGSNQPTQAGAPPKFMMYMMPIMFTVISFSLPSGLNLYWAFLNALSILQTYLINKKFPMAQSSK